MQKIGAPHPNAGVPEALDEDGFLMPEHTSTRAHEGAPIALSTLAGAKGSAVLLAPGGSGKTVAINQWRQREAGSNLINLAEVAAGDLRDELAKAVEAGGPVFVDGIDVIAREMPNFSNVVRKFMTNTAREQVVWRFACRPGVWTPLPDIAEYRLLPLDRLAARAVIADVVDDPDAFMEAITKARLGRLAGCPLQLRDAAEHWRQTGQLPTNQIESIRFEIHRLLQEHGDGYHPDLPMDRQLRLASRLAAFNVFCGVSAFAVRPKFATASAPTLVDLPSTPEPDMPGHHIDVAEVELVIGSALFEAGHSGALVFRHQQYAEFLAADYLVTRRVTPRQLADVLGVKDGIIPGSQIGVAAWLAALKPGLMNHLIASNGLQLARTGIDLPELSRVALTEALLITAANGAGDVDWTIDPSRLVHSELEAQLHRFAVGASDTTLIWWLGRLTKAGGYTSLADTMRRLSLDGTVAPHARRATVAALVEVGAERHLLALRPLLRLEDADDPDDEVLAAAITAMYPQLLTTSELLDVLRPRRNRHFFGAYLRLFAELAENLLSDVDVPIMLCWLAEKGHSRELEEDYGWFAEKLLGRAWRIMNTTEVIDGIAKLLHTLVGPPDFGHSVNIRALPWSEDTNVDRRRLLAQSLAERLSPSQWFELLHLGLLTAADAMWLIDTLPTMPASAQPAMVECLTPLLPNPTMEQIDRVLTLSPLHPAYESTRVWRDPIELESDLAQRLRRAHRRDQEIQERRDTITTHQIAGLTQAIAETATDVAQWWRVTLWLGEGIQGHDETFSHDLTTRTGWQYLSQPEREQVLHVGLDYVGRHQLHAERWFGHKTISVPEVLPDWSGVYLMTTLARHQPDLLSRLSDQVWQRWAPAIVGAWNYDRDEQHANLRCTLLDLASSSGLAAITQAALDYLDAVSGQDGAVGLRPLFRRLLPAMAGDVIDRIRQERYDAHLTRSLLDLLVDLDTELATSVSRYLTASTNAALSNIGRAALGKLAPTDIIHDLAGRQPDTGELASVVPHIGISVLDDTDLEALARLLLTAFPIDNDPPMEGFGFSSPEQQVRDVRRRVLDMLRERGNASALERLAEDRGPISAAVLLHCGRTARLIAAANSYTPNKPRELLEFLSRSDTRMVRNDADLMTVVIEQLKDLEREIGAGAYADLWNEHAPKSEDTISDWIKRHLQTRLSQGVVDREIQVTRRSDRGFGTRIDLTATSPTATHPIRTARVVIEAKLINNKELQNALSAQLVDRYLKPLGHPYGIYLVYWIDPIQRPAKWKPKGPTDRDALANHLQQQIASQPEFQIEPVLLDISRPRHVNAAVRPRKR